MGSSRTSVSRTIPITILILTSLAEVADNEDEPPASDYVGTLLRDPTSSHLLETLVARLPARAFDVTWDTYLKGQLSRLAVHPVANFVVAKALERASEEQVRDACGEIEAVGEKIYSEY